MAKVSFSKLNLKINSATTTVKINDQEVEVKNYLPINDKLALIAAAIEESADGNKFPNSAKLELFGNLEIIKNYTNISFTEKQLEDPAKLYDILVSSGALDAIIAVIPAEEYRFVINSITEISNAYYKYSNSAVGIMDGMKMDSDYLKEQMEAIEQKISDPESLSLVKDILSKLG